MGYQVELNTGTIINVPADCKTQYESIKKYGLQAVLERVSRTRTYKAEKSAHDAYVRAIICPNGDRVTQL